MGGSTVGSETYVPALDYFTTAEGRDRTDAFERPWLFYKLWGRSLYNPDTPDPVFSATFNRRYGTGDPGQAGSKDRSRRCCSRR